MISLRFGKARRATLTLRPQTRCKPAARLHSGRRPRPGATRPNGSERLFVPRRRPEAPFVRTAFAAAFRRLCLPRARALLRACRESDGPDAADRLSRLRTPLTARDRLAEGLRFVAFVVLPLGLGPSFTPARRALDKPIAMACLVLRAPCFPSRMWCISSRTNSPACVVGAFPARASLRARSIVLFSGIGWLRLESGI